MKSIRILGTLKNWTIPKCRVGLSTFNDNLYSLTPYQTDLRQSVRDFCNKELKPKAHEIDVQDNFKEIRVIIYNNRIQNIFFTMYNQFWKKMGDMGLNGITVPEKYGGLGGKYIDHVIVMEEISRASGSIGLSYGAHSNLCVNQINRNGTEKQKDKYLPKLISGEHIGALAMSEVNSGSDVVSMKCRAKYRDGSYILNGTKFWITNGSDADVLVIYAKTDSNSEKPQHGVTAFIVEKNIPGFSIGKKVEKLGMRGSNTCELIFDNCSIPEENVLGKVNKGIYVLFSGLDIERVVLSAGPIGLMQSACDEAFSYANERKCFNSKISHFQLIQELIADMYVRLSYSRSYSYNVAKALDNGRIVPKDCSGCILVSSQNAVKSSLNAIQILGGNGYTTEYRCGRLLRDAKLYEIGAGTNEIRKLIIGREIAKKHE
ncbi:Isovaleryl-CoA dehydrogenase, mitochondrial [Intoshia linei]|uniref:Isovaleryl-CoA dehydrogenase, mitochondrial n=1 Tax=Intoshia linei TaxID=1819745 RepID=A0A177B1L9_9BILA|nr:Isovaleryl-CoA dehydrogenase, mitochondrial [Intoshia linei]